MSWYISRATGVVTLLLFTAVLVLGLMVTRKGRLPGLPGFAVTSLHRNLSLLGLAFVVVHVLAAVLDGYVSIPLVSAVIPFASGYERFWLGLGAVALDLIIAIILTSLARGRLPRRWWRPVHLLAYLSWPVAFAHCLGASKDLRHGWLFDMAAACAILVVAATAWRLVAAARQPPRAARVMTVFTQHVKHSRGPGRTVREPTSR
jgi:sulfoxide reductase heme-binding subunit YedZ